MSPRQIDTGNRRFRTWILASSLSACLPDSTPVEFSDPEPGSQAAGQVAPVEDTLGFGSGQGGASMAPQIRSCVGQEAGAEILPAVLELVIDTSGSMGQSPPGSQRSKWVQTRSALLDAIDLMPRTSSLGLVFYPDQQTERDRCFDRNADVGIRPLGESDARQRQRLVEAFAQQSPEGGTPTHDAYLFALDELDSSDQPGEHFVVLMTDGVPTFSEDCRGTGLIQDPVDSAPLIDEAERALRRQRVRTFVIGSPGSEDARESLSRMAEAGGTSPAGCSHSGPNYCHFDMTEESDLAAALRDAFAEIAGQSLSCAIDIPLPPGGGTLAPGQVNVLFTPEFGAAPEVIGRNTASACSAGWEYSEDGRQVLLCGQTCDRIRDSGGELALEFGCESQLY